MYMSYFYCDQLTAYPTYPNIVYIECMCVERLAAVCVWCPAQWEQQKHNEQQSNYLNHPVHYTVFRSAFKFNVTCNVDTINCLVSIWIGQLSNKSKNDVTKEFFLLKVGKYVVFSHAAGNEKVANNKHFENSPQNSNSNGSSWNDSTHVFDSCQMKTNRCHVAFSAYIIILKATVSTFQQGYSIIT